MPLPPLGGGERARAEAHAIGHRSHVILLDAARLPLKAETVPEGDAR